MTHFTKYVTSFAVKLWVKISKNEIHPVNESSDESYNSPILVTRKLQNVVAIELMCFYTAYMFTAYVASLLRRNS